MTAMRIGIVGHGIVGSAMARFFSQQHQVNIYDKYQCPYNSTERKHAVNTCDLEDQVARVYRMLPFCTVIRALIFVVNVHLMLLGEKARHCRADNAVPNDANSHSRHQSSLLPE